VKVSVIITTFNKPQYLRWTLASIKWQKVFPDEVVVADDGSNHEVQEVLHSFRGGYPCPIKHSWIPDSGFRLSRSRNCAARKAIGDLLLFTDGDCILAPDYVQRAMALASDSVLLNGSRKLLPASVTEELLKLDPKLELAEHLFSGRKFWRFDAPIVRDFPRRSWNIFRGFSMVISRSIFETAGGFDESYRSWGLEDSDFAIRAISNGARIRDGRYALTVLHLYHPEPNNNERSKNSQRFQELLMETGIR
jgi:glycosyltransferase involved in cell wall biosynthesis